MLWKIDMLCCWQYIYLARMAVLARDCHKLLHALCSFKDLFSGTLVLEC